MCVQGRLLALGFLWGSEVFFSFKIRFVSFQLYLPNGLVRGMKNMPCWCAYGL